MLLGEYSGHTLPSMEETASVFHLITRFKKGGAEKTTNQELEALSRRANFKLHLGHGPDSDPDAIDGLPSSVEVHEFEYLRHYKPLALLVSVVQVAVRLRKEEIDILHTHSTEAGIVGRFAGALSGVPIVIHEIHGDPITEDRHWILNVLVLIMERLAAVFTTQFIAKSEQIKSLYLSRTIGQDDAYEIIYHGIDLESFKSSEPASDLESFEDPVFTFVGRLEDGKGLFDLIEAIERARRDRDLHLLIAGSGSEQQRLRDAIKARGLGSSVTMLGYRDDVANIYAITDVLVLPSYREGTPRVITEALASGVPVIATDIAGIPEQVAHEDNGLLIEPGDVEGLTAAIEAFCDSSAVREAYNEKTRKDISKFDREAVTERLLELYENLLVCRDVQGSSN